MALKIDYKKCNVCRICYEDCPGDVIGWDEDKNIPFIAYPNECWYCGNCEVHCPKQAIKVSISARFF